MECTLQNISFFSHHSPGPVPGLVCRKDTDTEPLAVPWAPLQPAWEFELFEPWNAWTELLELLPELSKLTILFRPLIKFINLDSSAGFAFLFMFLCVSYLDCRIGVEIKIKLMTANFANNL